MLKPTILVVEDDLDDQELVSQVIRENRSISCSIEICNNGTEALKYLSRAVRKPRLIVSDVNMPGVNGLELKKLIDADQRIRDMRIPFVFMSTSAQLETVKKAEELNVYGFFNKGGTYEEFVNNLTLIIQYWCNNRLPI